MKAQYNLYRADYQARRINKAEWERVQKWRDALNKRANSRLSNYMTTIRSNFDKIRTRNDDRVQKRLQRLELARENAI